MTSVQIVMSENIPRGILAQSAAMKQFIRCSPVLPTSYLTWCISRPLLTLWCSAAYQSFPDSCVFKFAFDDKLKGDLSYRVFTLIYHASLWGMWNECHLNICHLIRKSKKQKNKKINKKSLPSVQVDIKRLLSSLLYTRVSDIQFNEQFDELTDAFYESNC